MLSAAAYMLHSSRFMSEDDSLTESNDTSSIILNNFYNPPSI